MAVAQETGTQNGLASGNMGTKTCGLPQLFNFEPHPYCHGFWVGASKNPTNGHGSKSLPPVNIPFFPSKIGSKMGGEFTYPKMGSHWIFLTHSHIQSLS